VVHTTDDRLTRNLAPMSIPPGAPWTPHTLAKGLMWPREGIPRPRPSRYTAATSASPPAKGQPPPKRSPTDAAQPAQTANADHRTGSRGGSLPRASTAGPSEADRRSASRAGRHISKQHQPPRPQSDPPQMWRSEQNRQRRAPHRGVPGGRPPGPVSRAPAKPTAGQRAGQVASAPGEGFEPSQRAPKALVLPD
jgi:hypothetical protein